MDSPKYFARHYFAGRYWPPADGATSGVADISGSFAGTSTFTASLSSGAVPEHDPTFGSGGGGVGGGLDISRRKRRRRDEEDVLILLMAA